MDLAHMHVHNLKEIPAKQHIEATYKSYKIIETSHKTTKVYMKGTHCTLYNTAR